MNQVILKNTYREDLLNQRHWSVESAANRWRQIRDNLYKITESLSEDAGDVLSSLCFIVDESLLDASATGNLSLYADALQEVCDVLLSETADPRVHLLVVTELQKIVLPS